MATTEASKSLIELLADLVAIKTVSGDELSAAECLDYLESYLAGRGMHLRQHISKGFPSLVATSRSTKSPKVLLQVHMDVVPCSGPLFTLREKAGNLIGRGVYDMKFAAAVFLKLVDDLQDELSDYDFGLMFTFDEEVGGQNGVRALLATGYRAKVCILPDAGDNWRIETTHKGVWIVRLSVKGLAAHGSRPWDGDNAIHRLVDALHDISQLFKDQHAETDTLSVNQITGGRAVNQVADAAEAVLDVRFVSNELYEELSQKIEAIAAAYKISTKTVALVRCVKTDLNNPYVKSFLRIAERVHGKPMGTIRSLGASDAHYFDEVDIPVILLRPDGGSPHSDNEWIDKAGLEEYYEVIKAYVQKEAKA